MYYYAAVCFVINLFTISSHDLFLLFVFTTCCMPDMVRCIICPTAGVHVCVHCTLSDVAVGHGEPWCAKSGAG